MKFRTTGWLALGALAGSVWAGEASFRQAAATRPASGPAAVALQPGLRRITVPLPEREETGQYWLRVPPGDGPGQLPPLIICLHGTDDTARQMIDFWSARTMRLPALLAAPQGHGPGWSDSDLPTVRAMMADLAERFDYDPQRILIVGFSAGGAMAFELLYRERLPATAAAALANYVPPHLTREQVAARRTVPVFYAVGMSDINHERMRVGLEFLRSAGAVVEIFRPRIGHTLSPDVAQAAMDWFFAACARDVEARLERASRDADRAAGVAVLEAILAQFRWHEPQHVSRAAQTLDHLEEPGRADLRKAEMLQAAGQHENAVELLEGIETTYRKGRVADEARSRRIALLEDPRVAREVARRKHQARTDEAVRLFLAAQRAIAQGRHAEAAENCRRILDQYGETPTAARARQLLSRLQPRSTP